MLDEFLFIFALMLDRIKVYNQILIFAFLKIIYYIL
jgi:hypothetical protein